MVILRNRTAQMGLMVLMMLALAVLSWAFIQGQNRPATAAEMAQTIQQNRSALIDGIRAGQLLYWTSEEYIESPAMGYPQWTITEDWQVAGPDGFTEAAVATRRNLQGDLLGYTVVKNRFYAYTDVATGYTFEFERPQQNDMPMADAFAVWWDGLATSQGFSFSRRGSLNSRESLIYEKSSPGGSTFYVIEIVEDKPLLFRSSSYEGSSATPANLKRQYGIDEYRLLPIGSALPDPAAEASAGG